MPSHDTDPGGHIRLRTKIAIIIGIALLTIALIWIAKQFDPTQQQDISRSALPHPECVATHASDLSADE